MTISLPVATMLEMAARNNGFDRELPPVEGWLGFASTKAPLKVWLTVRQQVDYVAALSQHNVVNALADGAITTGPLPAGTVGARVVPGLPALHRMLRRAIGVDVPQVVKGLAEGHRGYLGWHRDKVFKTGVA